MAAPIHQANLLTGRRAHRDWRVWVGVILMLACHDGLFDDQ